jgi:cobalt-zinc-cadmium efflux system outer membrane protein
MNRGWLLAGVGCVLVGCVATTAGAQTTVTWPEARDRFRTSNPTLQAGQLGIDESRAAEVSAFLRPNPQFSLTFDQIGHTESGNIFSAANLTTAISYLHERQNKRELRLDSAQAGTAVAQSVQTDLERTLLFTLRTAFVQVLQAKAFQALAQANLTSYDQTLGVSRDRLQAGDIAQVDFDRLQLQRVTYESDVQTADVNLRTAKIQLLRLLNDHTTPVDQFDVTGPYDFPETIPPLEGFRQTALDVRPDLKAAMQAIDKARIDHRLALANGSTDPTITVDAGFPSISQVFASYQPPLRQYVGTSMGIPLRLFDRNQGEKLRTEIDVTRTERLADAAKLQVFSDVDTAYATVTSAVVLLRPYKASYLAQATQVRDTVAFSYQSGGASLLDLLQAQQEYRSLQVSYVNLIAAYLTAVAQLNLAVGQEALQ